MPDPDQKSTPPNAFHPIFLNRLDRRDEAGTASEAVTAGPWQVVPTDKGRHAVLRLHGGAHDEPEAFFCNRETALLFAAVLPSIGREPLFFLDTAEHDLGFAVQAVCGERGVQVVGRTRTYDQSYVEVLHVAESIVRNPHALACLIEAAGYCAVEIAGRMLWERARWA